MTEESSDSSSLSTSSDTETEIARPPNVGGDCQEGTSDEECQQHNEEAPIKRPRNPSEPTPEEKEKHWAVHLPCRSWCPVCVKARGREDPHRAQKNKVKMRICQGYRRIMQLSEMTRRAVMRGSCWLDVIDLVKM